jgi:hypothetical protein
MQSPKPASGIRGQEARYRIIEIQVTREASSALPSDSQLIVVVVLKLVKKNDHQHDYAGLFSLALHRRFEQGCFWFGGETDKYIRTRYLAPRMGEDDRHCSQEAGASSGSERQPDFFNLSTVTENIFITYVKLVVPAPEVLVPVCRHSRYGTAVGALYCESSLSWLVPCLALSRT